MIHLVVCDDDPMYLEYTKGILTREAINRGLEADIQKYASLEELLQAAESGSEGIDMLFLDIEFGEETSLETAKKISLLRPKCHIVFLTNYLSYALDVYEIPHLYYVIKDEFYERVGKIFEAYFQGEANAKIFASMGSEVKVIPLRDVCYIERMRRSCRIVTNEESVRTSELFEELNEKIHAVYMIRCHNSFMVNLQHVKTFHSGHFVMLSGEEIPISRAYRNTVLESFRKWMDVWV